MLTQACKGSGNCSSEIKGLLTPLLVEGEEYAVGVACVNLISVSNAENRTAVLRKLARFAVERETSLVGNSESHNPSVRLGSFGNLKQHLIHSTSY